MFRYAALLLGLLLFPTLSMAEIHEDHPYSFEVTKHKHKFSEMYRIKSEKRETYLGAVKKSAFRLLTNYDLSNADGWQATGITRILSVGAIYPWATDIDIYDTRGKQIAMIDGELATFESAKFSLYKYSETGKSSKIGTAYANADFSHFFIIDNGSNVQIAELFRDFSGNQWRVAVYMPEKIDDRLVRIFAGFVIHFEDTFKAKKS